MSESELTDIIEWDKLNWSKALRHWTQALKSKDPQNTKILVLGERKGGLSIWLARLGYTVICTDRIEISKEVRNLHKKYNLSSKITYDKADIFNLNFKDKSFDVVICKSVIGGLKKDYNNRDSRTLEAQRDAIIEVRRVLKSDGVFLGAENMVGSPIHKLFHSITGKDKGWRYLTPQEIKFIFSDFNGLQISYFGFLGTSYRSPLINKCFNFLDLLLSSIFPRSWLYISFIVASNC